ncbi:MAG: hypothetical protein WCI45_10605, partial [Desulfuromonadales bacterium]
CDPVLAEDVTEVFNFLTTGFMLKRKYSKLALAPRMLKKALIDKIEREIVQHQLSGGGLIQFKINALEDGDVVRSLYRASMAGVIIDLIVRDTCRLRPGIANLSETIRVVSVVGRFLEHARIYYFRNGGAEEYFIASADAMKRNLEARVEILCPIEPPGLARELRIVFDTHLSDQRSAWDMQSDGNYIQRTPGDSRGEGSHRLLIVRAKKRIKENLKKKKFKNI